MTDTAAKQKPLRKPKAKVEVNLNWCKKCGICVEFCPVEVFTADEFGAPIVSAGEKCTNCGLCVIRCPDFAVTLHPLEDDPEKQDKKESE